MQIPVKLLQKCENESLTKNKADVKKELAELTIKSAIDLDGVAHYNKRTKMIASVAMEDFEDAFERYNGDNDLLPINYFELGYLRSRAVGRLQYFDLEEMKPAVATGFLISNDLLMTNHHVFSTSQMFRDAQVEFEYEYDINGKEKDKIIFDLDPNKFFHANEELDFCIIGVNATDKTGSINISTRGYLVLNGNVGKAGEGDFASIIQYPEGHPQQVSIRENKVLDITQPDALTYSSDTSRGSSGSPVCNDQWQVIALHSAGVAKKDANGNYLDVNDEIIPVINGKVDGTRVVWLSNRGIRISAMIEYIQKTSGINTNHYILQLFTPTYTDDKKLAFLSFPGKLSNESSVSNSIAMSNSQGVVKPDQPQNIYLNISIGDKSHSISSGFTDTNNKALVSTTDSILFEKKIEDEIDFSECKGFDENFMGDQTPFPSLSDKLKKKIAFFVDNPNVFILKYHHYSTVQHAIRRMPVVSAINIYGKRRYSELEGRSDNWYRDRRIDLDVQLTDDFYKKSGFDKGHMSRREDAEWGASIGFAERAANMTCSYTNACPQVPDLNRGKFGFHGKWGTLEIDILENGVTAEAGEEARICVFNGPVFDESDPHFKGVQIPMRFWKIVVWRNLAKELKTTCFLLSQEKLVGNIQFEELHFDDIFKKSQCSIALIEKLTLLKFNKIRDWDTFEGSVAGEEERLLTDEDFEKLIIKNKSVAILPKLETETNGKYEVIK